MMRNENPGSITGRTLGCHRMDWPLSFLPSPPPRKHALGDSPINDATRLCKEFYNCPIHTESPVQHGSHHVLAIPVRSRDCNPDQTIDPYAHSSGIYSHLATTAHTARDSHARTIAIPPRTRREGSGVSCRWYGCNSRMTEGTSTSAVRKHFRDKHGGYVCGEQRLRCGWPQCKTELLPGSIAKHVANCHFYAARRQCDQCFKYFTTKDSLERHKLSCRSPW